VIPKAFWQPVYEEAMKRVRGDSETLIKKRSNALLYLQKFGVSEEMVLNILEIKNVQEITADHLVILRGFCTSLKEGTATVEEVFAKPSAGSDTKGNEAVKEKLKKTKPKEESKTETVSEVKVEEGVNLFIDDNTINFPTQLSSFDLMQAVSVMFPPDRAGFIRHNLETKEMIMEIMRKEGHENMAISYGKFFQ